MKHEKTARRLRDAMAERNIIAQDLAEQAGVSKASISQYINGSHKPSNVSAGKMAEVLEVSPLWLMGFDVPRIKKAKTTDMFYGSSFYVDSIPQTDTERRLVLAFRKADKTTQDIIMRILEKR